MVHVSHEIWALTIVALLIGLLILKTAIRRKKAANAMATIRDSGPYASAHADIEHRALMYLMAEKTDSLLGALAQTIEQERQKLGGVVRNPSMAITLDQMQTAATPAKDSRTVADDAVGPLAQKGIDAAAIAHQLRMQEEEVALILQLNAA